MLYYTRFQITLKYQISLQCISSFTDVDTGTEILLFDAWQVRIVWRSSLRRWFSLNSLVTLIFPEILPSDSISSETSSSKAWSLHQVTLGVGRPDKNWNLKTETMGYGIVENYYLIPQQIKIWLSRYVIRDITIITVGLKNLTGLPL